MLNMGQGYSREQRLDIAVIGKSGSGKSTFINSYAHALHTAETDVIEGTSYIAPYYKKIPVMYRPPDSYKQIMYFVRMWDFPGFGTQDYPERDYIRILRREKFDFYLLLSTSRVSEFERKIHNYLVKRGKTYFYIRTGIDKDINNYRRDYPDSSEDEIKQDILNDIKNNVSTEPEIYLINAEESNKYDFPKLDKELVPYILEAKESKKRFKAVEDGTSSCSMM